ncbi:MULTISPECIES: hypothetical protein [unclassified Chelatococcus]|uniref:hypothetical protein n=1 Tax=unclassified Chelatococcus TaxID=2638111 RepID=UPI0020BECB9A|nr:MULTISPECIES: hypothetical protein [unclassified Chelatococcus]MCO5079836.1 hypothetical protein [Chelatococcus sp.]CAH1657422.1 conserved exported hypothetical protein [Hyphomicrobiales bacterium]CAH1684432.1 conserved exported hypothetical protein [Hyphomicrobiales bacterium]
MINPRWLATLSSSTMKGLRGCILAAVFLISANAAYAADPASIPESGTAPTAIPKTRAANQSLDRSWRVIVSPYVWGASLTGKSYLYGRHAHVDIPFSETLKNLDFSFMGNVEVTNGAFGVYVDGQYTKTSQHENVYNNRLGLSVTSSLIAAGAYYRVYEHRLGGTNAIDRPRVFAIEPTAGLRWTRLKAGLNLGPYEVSRKVEWVDPFVGLRLYVDLDERWNIAAEGDVGGFSVGSDLSLNGQIYLGYRTELLGVPANLRVGYRALYQDYKTNNSPERFAWDVTQHGPVVGVSLRF